MAEGPSGTVIAVVQQANIDGKTGKLVIEPKQSVFSGDKIETGPVGQAQIIFQDNTKLVVGPNSAMVIDAFVFDNNKTAKKFSINVVKGAFRFITGDSPKNAYQITTPTATIGVRGTEFDIAIEKEGTTRVANFEGMTHICKRDPANPDQVGDNCVDVSEPCSLSVARPEDSKVLQLSNKDLEYRNRQLKYYFPYVRSQVEPAEAVPGQSQRVQVRRRDSARAAGRLVPPRRRVTRPRRLSSCRRRRRPFPTTGPRARPSTGDRTHYRDRTAVCLSVARRALQFRNAQRQSAAAPGIPLPIWAAAAPRYPANPWKRWRLVAAPALMLRPVRPRKCAWKSGPLRPFGTNVFLRARRAGRGTLLMCAVSVAACGRRRRPWA